MGRKETPQLSNKQNLDLYKDSRQKRKAIGSHREAENTLSEIRSDILRGEFMLKKENRVHFESFMADYLDYARHDQLSLTSSKLRFMLPAG